MEIWCTGVILSVCYNVTRSLQIRYSKRHVANRNFYRWLCRTTVPRRVSIGKNSLDSKKKRHRSDIRQNPEYLLQNFTSFAKNLFLTRIKFKRIHVRKHIYIYFLQSFPFISFASISTLLYTQTRSSSSIWKLLKPIPSLAHFNNPGGGESSERLNPIIRRLVWLGRRGGGREREVRRNGGLIVMPFKMHEE